MESARDIITLAILFTSLYFEVFMLITYLEKRGKLHRQATTAVATHPDLPGVTIIVPCFNEEKTVTGTINSLLALNYPIDKLHIIAVNDGSTDGTLEALEGFKGNSQIHIISKENGGKHTALNLGIEQATTAFVGCLDADSYATPEALLRIMTKFKDQKVMAVVPSLHVYNAKTIIQRMQKTEYLIRTFLHSVLAELNAVFVTPGPLSVFRKSVFEQIGYYKKAHNTEDMEMALRMHANHLTIASAHDAVVYTSSPKTTRILYKQRVRWTSGFFYNTRDYRRVLLKPSHGYIGGFILPLMILSTASVSFIALGFIYDFGHMIQMAAIRFQAIGTHALEWSWPNINWFFVHTSTSVFTTIIALTIVLAFILIGSNLTTGNRPRIGDVACYAFLYSLIAPLWILRSIANVALSKQTVWR